MHHHVLAHPRRVEKLSPPPACQVSSRLCKNKFRYKKNNPRRRKLYVPRSLT